MGSLSNYKFLITECRLGKYVQNLQTPVKRGCLTNRNRPFYFNIEGVVCCINPLAPVINFLHAIGHWCLLHLFERRVKSKCSTHPDHFNLNTLQNPIQRFQRVLYPLDTLFPAGL